MAHDVVDGHAAWESDSALEFLGLLTIVDLAEFFLDELVDGLTVSINISANLIQLKSLSQSSYAIRKM